MKQILKSIVISILIWEARATLWRHKPRIIAITGNVGKTSTKDAVYAVISQAFKARKSKKSFNSEIGLPLTILGLENAWSSAKGWVKNLIEGFAIAFFGKEYPQWLVLEIGADHPKDIEKVTKWLHPDITVLTRMSDVPVHVEYFKDASAVLREKMFLAKALKKDGTLVVNGDDPHFIEAVKEIDRKKIFYGTTPGASVEILETEIMYTDGPVPLPRGQYAIMRMGETEARIELCDILGNHIMYPIAAACSVATVLGIQSNIPLAFCDFETPKGRMRIVPGISSSVIIDDTYNSSPLACREALRTIASLSLRGKKIAALGDMKELGENAEKAHLEIGKLAGETLHTLVTVGEMARLIAEGARKAGMATDRIYERKDSKEAGKVLFEILRAGDAVLVKGSQSMRMERAVEMVLADPGKASDLLVRQEKEWKQK